MDCKKCGGKGTILYYHDAGDHFGAGTSPWSEWVEKPCPECGKMAEKKKQTKASKNAVSSAIRYAKQLDW